MAEAERCSRCGAQLPRDALGGHCAHCLLKLALSAGNGAQGSLGSGEIQDRSCYQDPQGCIGQYRLLERIGEGGSGIVYSAKQRQPLRRRVAIKVLKPGMDTRRVVARFETERQVLALMDHPAIAQVYDAGTTAEGRPYFVMELVTGIPITEYCDRKRFSTAQRLGLFIEVCQAIQHAHAKRVIHRDIKPTNILVTEHEGRPLPKVIEFGIAKATGGHSLVEETVFTSFEHCIGTPAYMSPEQAGLGALEPDTRTDVYGLGVLLYELLTGQTPFDARALRQAALDEALRLIREAEPPKPSERLGASTQRELALAARRRRSDPASLRSVLSGDLDCVVMKALEKEPCRRYQTPRELALDLQRYLRSEPVLARPPSRIYRLQKSVRRNRVAVAATVAVAVSLILGLGVSITLLIREHRDRRRALRAEELSRAEAERRKEIADLVRQILAREQIERADYLRNLALLLQERLKLPDAQALAVEASVMAAALEATNLSYANGEPGSHPVTAKPQ